MICNELDLSGKSKRKSRTPYRYSSSSSHRADITSVATKAAIRVAVFSCTVIVIFVSRCLVWMPINLRAKKTEQALAKGERGQLRRFYCLVLHGGGERCNCRKIVKSAVPSDAVGDGPEGFGGVILIPRFGFFPASRSNKQKQKQKQEHAMPLHTEVK
jgi:hypothetical protein